MSSLSMAARSEDNPFPEGRCYLKRSPAIRIRPCVSRKSQEPAAIQEKRQRSHVDCLLCKVFVYGTSKSSKLCRVDPFTSWPCLSINLKSTIVESDIDKSMLPFNDRYIPHSYSRKGYMFCFHDPLASNHLSSPSWKFHVACKASYAKGNYHHLPARRELIPRIPTRPRLRERTFSLAVRRLPALRELIPHHVDRSSQNPPTHRLPRPSIEISLQASPLTTQQAALITAPPSLSNHGRHNSSTSTPSSITSIPS